MKATLPLLTLPTISPLPQSTLYKPEPATSGNLLLSLWKKTEEKTAERYRFDPKEFYPALKTRLLILQPTPFCNISCSYCYLPDRDSKTRMTIDTVRQATQRLCDDDLVGEALTVVWHAGEPLAMPIDFYEDAIATVAEVLGPRVQISHSIQTNATLINDAWCRLFKKHNIRIGVSVDGPAHLHDKHRHTRSGKGTHDLVLGGMELLRTHGIVFHAIAVVTDATLANPDDFFDFFVQQGVQDIGCNFDEAEGIHSASSISGKEDAHARFLRRLLYRSRESNGQVRVRELANGYRLIADALPTFRWRGETWPDNAQVMPFLLITVAWSGDFCTFSPELLGQPSLEFGDFLLGNVNHDSYFSIIQSERFTRMWSAIVKGTQACRQSCSHFNYCGGGAPANKLFENGTFSSTETLYCRAMLKKPFDIVLAQLEEEQSN